MKILIVDDERLTREGLMTSIDWKSLGILDVLLADDGLHGLELARQQKPEIVLSDIRMPRMDGILMSEKIKELMPDTSIIFMSGYSDKEYLKAAIKLKAINYVEKPLDPLEVEEAILEAIEENKQINRTKHSETLHSLEKASRLAMMLTYPTKNNSDIDDLLKNYPTDIQDSMNFTTIIVKFTNSSNEFRDTLFEETNTHLRLLLFKYHMQYISVIKHEQHVVYHIYGNVKPSSDIIDKVGHFLQKEFAVFGKFFIAIGTTVNSIYKVYDSYSSAVILMQSSFFYDYNSILFKRPNITGTSNLFTDPAPQYNESLSSKNQEDTNRILKEILQSFKNSNIFLPNQVKDIYYKLFMILQNACKKLQISSSHNILENESILEYLEEFQTLEDLHQSLCLKTEDFYMSLENQIPENSTIYLIKDFIRNNYCNENISVKDISEHVYLSASYVCTLFKTETGQTLNQYITEYRMEKARQLLADSRNKITDISSKVGYTDGNYFSKSFKKIVGLSPSEYREKMVR